MNAIERRLLVQEARQHDRERKLAPDEQRSAVARLLTAEGLTEAEAIAKFGGIPAFVHHLMTRPDPEYTPPVSGALDAYRRECR